jgi:hypothetical protein
MTDWSRSEVEAIVDDYLSMLSKELAGVRYNKTAHRQALQAKLVTRSNGSIEFKHANISAALRDAGIQPLIGYKPRSNYQALIVEVLAERIERDQSILELAAFDAERPMVVPEVDDILAILTSKPAGRGARAPTRVAEPPLMRIPVTTNYLELEARNRSLGNAGEAFVINYERARLIDLGKERLAACIEHTAQVRGDHEGYDILSFEESGQERLIEVKTTKYGSEIPFYVSRNEVAVSKREAEKYQVYRLFEFGRGPRLYTLPGAIDGSCLLSPTTYLAVPK